MRFIVAVLSLGLAISSRAQPAQFPHASQLTAGDPAASGPAPDSGVSSSSEDFTGPSSLALSRLALSQVGAPASPTAPASQLAQVSQPAPASQSAPAVSGDALQRNPDSGVPVDANGNPIPLERRQPRRILGFMPNFRTVSGGAQAHPPGWKYNFTVATHQATDYSTFIFLGLTSVIAEGMDMHPSLGKGMGGYYAYTWRGFLDKSDGTYLSAWLLPSVLHEDTRFYALGSGHSLAERGLYVISRQAVARTYGGRQTPNIAGLGGKVLTQVFSRYYYPPSATSFGVLASKFGYSVMRDVMFSSLREFYPDIAAHFIRRSRAKTAQSASAGTSAQ